MTSAQDEWIEEEAFASTVVEQAGALALAHFRQTIEVTDKAAPGVPLDPVTAADRAVEAHLRQAIHARFPSHGVQGEEQAPALGRSALSWMIDPIDGTRGFMSGFLHWCTLLALRHDERPVIGVVHQPFTGETWIGGPRGAFFRRGLERRSVTVRSCPALAEATLATTDPYLFAGAEADAFEDLRQRVRLTRFGSDAYAYCLLAMGHLDLVVESGLQPWDVQALIPLVRSAGGIISNWRGDDCRLGGQVIAAADPTLHHAALERLAPAAV